MAHLPVLAKMRGVQIAALCDNDGAKARALAERFDVSDVCSDIEELLEIPDLDGVMITTPNHLHEVHVLSALRAKLGVLCERPLALSARGVERIIAASEKAKRVVMVANNQRFRHDTQTLDAFLRGGELGKLRAVRAGAYRRRVQVAWRLRRAEAGGGAFFELGLPLLDLAGLDHRRAARDPRQRVDGARPRRQRGGGSRDRLHRMRGWLHGHHRRALELRRRGRPLVVRGDRLPWLGAPRAAAHHEGAARAPIDVSPQGASTKDTYFIQSYRSALAHFASVLRGDTAYEPPLDQVRLFKLVDAIYKAADDAKEMRL